MKSSPIPMCWVSRSLVNLNIQFCLYLQVDTDRYILFYLVSLTRTSLLSAAAWRAGVTSPLALPSAPLTLRSYPPFVSLLFLPSSSPRVFDCDFDAVSPSGSLRFQMISIDFLKVSLICCLIFTYDLHSDFIKKLKSR